jgi:hypothetical protein
LTKLRGVYRYDPVPTGPDDTVGYRHIGREVHFYSCNEYIAYPFGADDTAVYSMMGSDGDMVSLFDHMGYLCLTSTSQSYASAF